MSTAGVVRPAFSPLEIDALSRPYYAHFDAYAAARLAPLYDLSCYQPKFYKAPALSKEVISPGAVVNTGLKITPGSLIYGLYLPGLVETLAPLPFMVQVKDVALQKTFWSRPIPSILLANFKPTGLSANPVLANGAIFSYPNLFVAEYPVLGDGLFNVDIWNTGPDQQRIELVFGVLEVVEC